MLQSTRSPDGLADLDRPHGFEAARVDLSAPEPDARSLCQTLADAEAARDAHRERSKRVIARTPPAERLSLWREFKRIGREEGYRTEVVTVRELHKSRAFGGVMPAARPREARARPRTRARRAAHRTRAGPDDDDGESEPGESPGFERFHELTARLPGTARLALAAVIPGLERALWRDLERSCAEQIDHELEKARG